jgi:hypothetical protein
MQAQKLQFPIAEIGEYAEQLHAGFSLFIPRARVAPVVDHELLSKIDSSEHLDDITH